MRVLDCPECAVKMQPFFAAPPDKGLVVELDRCPKCTRLWFDVRELERAAGRSFLPRLRGADATHACHVCKTPLHTSLIRGDVPIEECATCSGALLDAHDFELISGKRLQEAKAPPPPPAPKKPKLVEFSCARCGQRKPMGEAVNLKGATVCRACSARPWPDQPAWYNKGTDPLADLLDDLFGNLFR